MSAENLAALTAAIGSIADQSEHYRIGLSRVIERSGKPLSDFTLKELLNIHTAYQAYYRRLLNDANTVNRASTAH